MKLSELITERAKIWETQKAINDKALAEKRDLTKEEQETWDKADADFLKVDADIKAAQEEEQREARAAERQAKAADREKFMAKSQDRPHKPDPEDATDKKDKRASGTATASKEYREAFNYFLRTGDMSRIDTEFRALQAQSDVAGGFVVAPEQFIADLIKDLEDEVFVRRYARVISMPTAASLTAPELANRIGNPTWTAENSALTAVMQ